MSNIEPRFIIPCELSEINPQFAVLKPELATDLDGNNIYDAETNSFNVNGKSYKNNILPGSAIKVRQTASVMSTRSSQTTEDKSSPFVLGIGDKKGGIGIIGDLRW